MCSDVCVEAWLIAIFFLTGGVPGVQSQNLVPGLTSAESSGCSFVQLGLVGFKFCVRLGIDKPSPCRPVYRHWHN